MMLDEVSGPVADVEIDTLDTESLHFKVNRPSHDISRRPIPCARQTVP